MSGLGMQTENENLSQVLTNFVPGRPVYMEQCKFLNRANRAQPCTVRVFSQVRTRVATVPVKKLTCFLQVPNLHT